MYSPVLFDTVAVVITLVVLSMLNPPPTIEDPSTHDHLGEILNALEHVDKVYDILLPKAQKLSKKLINTHQQLSYLSQTRANSCLPLGIAKQCKFTYSGHDPDIQAQLQQIFHEAGSRSLDIIHNHTKNTTESLKRKFYSHLDVLKSACTDSGIDYPSMHLTIQKSMRSSKQDISKKHAKKLTRDQKYFKLYQEPITPNQQTLPDPTRNKKNRRFNKQKKVKNRKKTPRKPKHKLRRQKMKSSNLPATINMDKYFYNLTNVELSEHHKMIFCLGQKFCPTPKSANWADFETAIDNWSYLLRYAVAYHGKPRGDRSSYERQLVKNDQRKPISSSGRPALELYLQKVREDLLTQKSKKFVALNITPEQQNALREMKFWDRDKGIIIRPYDKGSGFFMDYKDSYRERILAELQSDLYMHVTDKAGMFVEVVNAIQTWRCKWEGLDHLTPTLCEWIIPDSNKKQPLFT